MKLEVIRNRLDASIGRTVEVCFIGMHYSASLVGVLALPSSDDLCEYCAETSAGRISFNARAVRWIPESGPLQVIHLKAFAQRKHLTNTKNSALLQL